MFLRFTIWEEKEAEFHEKLQRLKNPDDFEVCNLRTVVREIKECVTKVRTSSPDTLASIIDIYI